MQILPHDPVKMDDWAVKVKQLPLPDWRNRAHDEFRRRGRQWQHDPSERPWFDRPGAMEKVEALRARDLISSDEAALLAQFVSDGYFVLENAIDDPSLLDEYNRDLDAVWSGNAVRDGLQVSG